MPTLTETLVQAVQIHQSGDVQRAEQMYRQIIQADPNHPDAWCFLGVACLAMKRYDEAIANYQQALRLRPNNPAVLSDLGVAYANLGRLDEAVDNFQRALHCQPNHADAYNNLGVVLGQQGRFAEAATCYERAIQLKPDYVGAHNNLGLAYMNLNRWQEAEASLRRAVQLKPDYTDAYSNLGLTYAKQGRWEESVAYYQQSFRLGPPSAEAHSNMGFALRQLGRLDDAALSYQQALWIKQDHVEALSGLGLVLTDLNRLNEAEASLLKAVRIKPDCAEALNNLGLTLMKQTRSQEAVATLREAQRLNPKSVEVHNNLGLALGDLDLVDEAQAALQEAIRLSPQSAEVYNNLGMILAEQGRFDESLSYLQKALQLKPDYPEPHFIGSMIYLLRGDFERGWTEYEWRWKCKKFAKRAFYGPMWDGSPLAGRTLFVHAEQGLGDTIQFIRYAPLVKRLGCQVLVECREPVIKLLATCAGIDHLILAGSASVSYDMHAPLLSLPAILRTTLETMPADVPYLHPDPELVRWWGKEVLSAELKVLSERHHSPLTTHHSPLLKIGIAWQGNPDHKTDRHRSVKLTRFTELAKTEGVRLFSLQKGPGFEQLAPFAEQFPIIDLGSRFTTFMDTAAALKNLDLIITVDSSVAHCAGALAIPVWVFLPTVPDWRWLLEGEKSPWYPTMRLFRQKTEGDWDEVFKRITEEARRLVAQSCTG